MPQVYIEQNFQIWPKTKLSSFQSTVPPLLSLPQRILHLPNAENARLSEIPVNGV